MNLSDWPGDRIPAFSQTPIGDDAAQGAQGACTPCDEGNEFIFEPRSAASAAQPSSGRRWPLMLLAVGAAAAAVLATKLANSPPPSAVELQAAMLSDIIVQRTRALEQHPDDTLLPLCMLTTLAYPNTPQDHCLGLLRKETDADFPLHDPRAVKPAAAVSEAAQAAVLDYRAGLTRIAVRDGSLGAWVFGNRPAWTGEGAAYLQAALPALVRAGACRIPKRHTGLDVCDFQNVYQ